MPLLLSKSVDSQAIYAVWKIVETEGQLEKLCSEEAPEGHSNKRSEWMTTRILAKQLCESNGIKYSGITSDDHGKPWLNDSDLSISISHSWPMAAVMISKRALCGIDLERPREQLVKARSKFLHEMEVLPNDELEILCEVWCAKEVAFKVHGRKAVSLKNDISVVFNNETLSGALLSNGSSELKVGMKFERIKGYVLAYSQEVEYQ